jgi:hypothetical protein
MGNLVRGSLVLGWFGYSHGASISMASKVGK